MREKGVFGDPVSQQGLEVISASHEHVGGGGGHNAASGLLRVRSDAGLLGGGGINDPGKLHQLTTPGKGSRKSCKEEKGLSNFPQLCTANLLGSPYYTDNGWDP